jgi:hypothetical protein
VPLLAIRCCPPSFVFVPWTPWTKTKSMTTTTTNGKEGKKKGSLPFEPREEEKTARRSLSSAQQRSKTPAGHPQPPW